MGPHQYGPSPSQPMANSAQQPVDPHSSHIGFAGSPSMGIMTPEQINMSTSQLMNSAFHGNPTPPGPQGNPLRPNPLEKPQPRNPRPNSQPQRFPPQERFRNFTPQQLKQPVVQYVADNNPFSDDFEIHKVVNPDKPQPTKIFPKQEPIDDLPTKHEAHLPAIPDIQDISSHIPPLDVQSNEPSLQSSKSINHIDSGLTENEAKTNHGERANVVVKCEKVEDTQSNDNQANSDQSADGTGVDGKKGVSSQALQRLESMVADMGGDEAGNLQGEAALESEMCFDLFNTNPDDEVANLCSPRNKDQQMVSICKSSSQANSVASLECHEEVPSFVSPVQDGSADKADNKDTSQVNSPAAQLPENIPQDSSNIEPASNTNTSDPIGENYKPQNDITQSEPGSFDEGHEVNQSQSELTAVTTVESTPNCTQELQQSVATTPETSSIAASIATVSSISSGVLGGHLQLPMEAPSTEGDMANLGNFTTQPNDPTFNIRPSNPEMTTPQPDHGAMLLSGRDPMLGAANPMLSSSSTNTAMLGPVPIPKTPAKKSKVKRSRTEARSREEIQEDDIIKKTLQEARRQEYERKKREYEEQQRRKRELQKELRQQKARQKEERKRQRQLNSPNKMKSKENHIQKVRKGDNNLAVITKESLPLCEPKLILTHALMHPYGTSPFNGQCSLIGALGNAHIDNSLDFYAKFPTPSLELVLKINQQKTLVNGDTVNDVLDSKDFMKFRDIDLPIKRARHNANEFFSSAIATSAALLSTDTSSINSLSSSPETLQYVASSSPESDPVNKSNIPRFSALDETNRSNNDSPVFSPINPLNIKSERLLSTSCCSVRPNDTTSNSKKDTQIAPPHRTGPLLSLDQDIDDLDSINVTLTLSPSSEIRVSETVASVAELIGCSPPRPSDIVIEPSWKSGGSITTTVPTTTGGLMFPHPRTPQGLSVLSPKEVDNLQKSPYPFTQFNLATTKSEPQRKASDGPYCRHCDVLIIVIGFIRGPPDIADSSSSELRAIKADNTSQSDSNSEGTNYKIYNINVDANERRDCFCSEECLKQFYSLLEKGRSKTKTENPEEQLTDSTTTTGVGNVTADSEQDHRGSEQAEGLPVTAMMKVRRPSWKEEQVDGVSKISI